MDLSILKVQIKETFIEWILASTSHGLPNIFRTNHIILKIIWICCFLTSTVYCVYSIIKSLQDFLQYPTYINSVIIQEMPSIFPAISICNIKAFNKSAIDLYYPTLFNLTDQIMSQFSMTTPTMIQQSSIYVMKALIQQNSLFVKSKDIFGFQLSSMLISCTFNFNDCGLKDFNWFYDTSYGNCYTFNKINPLEVSIASDSYGLQLDLFVGNPSKQTQYEAEDGIVLLVHNQTAFPMFSGDKLVIPTNAVTNIAIERTFISKLGQPYGDCLEDTSNSSTFSSEFFDYILNILQVSYDQQLCLSLCMQKLTASTCGCQNAILQLYSNNRMCLSTEDTICVMSLISKFNNGTARNACLPSCPMECNSVQYILTTSKSIFPTTYYKNLLYNHPILTSSGVTYDNIDKSVLRVNVFYKTLKYTSIEEQPATSTETFISNIGGTLGLYIGISLLSLIEMVDLIIQVSLLVFNYLCTKNTKITDIKGEFLTENTASMTTVASTKLFQTSSVTVPKRKSQLMYPQK